LEDIYLFNDALLANRRFVPQLAYLLGKTAFAAYLIGLGDRNPSNIRVDLDLDTVIEMYNIDFVSAFTLDKDDLSTQAGMLQSLLSNIAARDIRPAARDSFISGFTSTMKGIRTRVARGELPVNKRMIACRYTDFAMDRLSSDIKMIERALRDGGTGREEIVSRIKEPIELFDSDWADSSDQVAMLDAKISQHSARYGRTYFCLETEGIMMFENDPFYTTILGRGIHWSCSERPRGFNVTIGGRHERLEILANRDGIVGFGWHSKWFFNTGFFLFPEYRHQGWTREIFIERLRAIYSLHEGAVRGFAHDPSPVIDRDPAGMFGYIKFYYNAGFEFTARVFDSAFRRCMAHPDDADMKAEMTALVRNKALELYLSLDGGAYDEKLSGILVSIGYPENAVPALNAQIKQVLPEDTWQTLTEQSAQWHQCLRNAPEGRKHLGQLMLVVWDLFDRNRIFEEVDPPQISMLLVNSLNHENIFDVIDADSRSGSESAAMKACLARCIVTAQLTYIILAMLGFNVRGCSRIGHCFVGLMLDKKRLLVIDFILNTLRVVNVRKYYRKAGVYWVLKPNYKISGERVIELEQQYQAGVLDVDRITKKELLNLFYFGFQIMDKPGVSCCIYNNLGAVYAEFGHYDAALSAYRKALEQNPDYASVLYNRSMLLYYRQGYFQQAIIEMQKAIELNPACHISHVNLGAMSLALGFEDMAQDSFIKAVSIRQDMIRHVPLWFRARVVCPSTRIDASRDGGAAQSKSWELVGDGIFPSLQIPTRIPLRLHITLVIPIALFALTGWELLLFYIAVLLSVLAHEFSHIRAARRYGFETDHITLHILGGTTAIRDMKFRDPKQEFLVSIAGPLASFGIAASLFVPAALLGASFNLFAWPIIDMASPLAWLVSLGLINWILGIFNLFMPMYPLDSGRVIRSLLAMKTNVVYANRVTVVYSRIVAVSCIALAVLSVIGILPFYVPFSLGIIGVFVLMFSAFGLVNHDYAITSVQQLKDIAGQLRPADFMNDRNLVMIAEGIHHLVAEEKPADRRARAAEMRDEIAESVRASGDFSDEQIRGMKATLQMAGDALEIISAKETSLAAEHDGGDLSKERQKLLSSLRVVLGLQKGEITEADWQTVLDPANWPDRAAYTHVEQGRAVADIYRLILPRDIQDEWHRTFGIDIVCPALCDITPDGRIVWVNPQFNNGLIREKLTDQDGLASLRSDGGSLWTACSVFAAGFLTPQDQISLSYFAQAWAALSGGDTGLAWQFYTQAVTIDGIFMLSALGLILCATIFMISILNFVVNMLLVADEEISNRLCKALPQVPFWKTLEARTYHTSPEADLGWIVFFMTVILNFIAA
ncbi:MAG TPA: tetratricopeptide repeat protein, partial [Candidatus Omnitrophota bacterium]|nr:tetratricopeptide repeat protein [Candidatus Omnitrophota bacterium]